MFEAGYSKLERALLADVEVVRKVFEPEIRNPDRIFAWMASVNVHMARVAKIGFSCELPPINANFTIGPAVPHDAHNFVVDGMFLVPVLITITFTVILIRKTRDVMNAFMLQEIVEYKEGWRMSVNAWERMCSLTIIVLGSLCCINAQRT